MRFWLIYFVFFVMLLSACSSTHRQHTYLSRAAVKQQPDNRPIDDARIQSLLDQKNIRDGGELAIKTHQGKFYRGIYLRALSDKVRLTILQNKGSAHERYMSLPLEMINTLYLPAEADRVEAELQAENRIREAYSHIDAGIRNNDTFQIKYALEHGANLGPKPGNQYTPLHSAARTMNRPEIIRFLVENGADPNVFNEEGLTPLMVSIQVSQFDNARALVESGADLYLKSPEHGMSAASMAFSQLRWVRADDRENAQAFADYLVRQKGVNPDIRYDDPVYKADNSLGMNGLRLMELSEKECFHMLDSHDIKYRRPGKVGEVIMPVEVLSKIKGVKIQHTGFLKKNSIMDCRLVVALIGLGPVLQKYHVKEIRHMRTYSAGARIGGRGDVSGHHYALALDIAEIFTHDGNKYHVYKDWKDRRYRAEPCKAQDTDDKKQTMLRNMICDIAGQDIFHWILTPHYNKAHYDHFHVEIRQDVDAMIFN